MTRLRGTLSNGDGLAQAVQQPFEVGHALAQFGDLLLQGRKSLAEFLPLGGEFGAEVFALGSQFPAEFGLFGIKVPPLFRQFGTDGPLPAQH